MEAEELAGILEKEYQSADSYHGHLEELQDQAFRYYEAQPFGNEQPGRSQVVLPDVQETIDYMVPSILRLFVSGDRTVEIEATNEDDEQHADDATATINYNFMKGQQGFRILHDVANDGCMKKIGIFKAGVETRERVSRETLMLPSLDMLGLIDGEIEGEPEQNEDGTFTVKVKTERTETVFVDYAVPTNEFRFSSDARNEDEAHYISHVQPVTRSDLVEMGFDPGQVYELPAYEGFEEIRRNESEIDNFVQDESSEALRKVLLHEEYARIDVDGDGIAERIKCYRVGNEILLDAETGEPSIETVDDQPFSVFCPFPRPHLLVGYSLADKVMDIQLSRSYVARQMNDGLANANLPRYVVEEDGAGDSTYNDILTPIPGSPIRVKRAGAVQPISSSFRIGESLQAMEFWTGERESRTGITRMNQGLDADTLNKTATGTALMQAQGQQQEEYVARNFAEAVSRLFLKKYNLMRNEGVVQRVKVDGQYKEIDPSQWPEDVNMVIRVGLGSGSKDKRIQNRMAIVPIVSDAVVNKLSTPEHAFNLMDGLVRDMGIGQGDDFMTDPNAPPELGPDGQPIQQEPEVDPEQEAMMAEQQAKQAEMQMKQQETAARLQLDQEKAQSQIQLEREKAAANIEVTREKGRLDMQLSRERAAQEAELGRERMIMEAQLKREQMVFDGSQNADLNENREGGRLDA